MYKNKKITYLKFLIAKKLSLDRGAPFNQLLWRTMTKKSLLYVLFIYFASQASANSYTYEENEDAFYALSSLRYHLEEELDDPRAKTHTITFDSTDVAKLWVRAAGSPYAIDIAEAELNYQEAIASTSDDRMGLLLKVKQVLDLAWVNLNTAYNRPFTKGFENHRYVLPADHWLRANLDDIFTRFDAQKNERIFKEAGFEMICKRNSNMIVAKHDSIAGYIIKIYLLEDKPEQSWKWICKRCEGAENVRRLIKSKKLKLFNVPDKWLYPLPHALSKGLTASLGKHKSPACLVATHMNIVSHAESKRAWKEKITHAHLRELYCIFSHGFASTFVQQNIPYTKEGLFTCLDTEVPFRHHKYSAVNQYLNDEMSNYWDMLVKTGGRP